MNFSNKIKWIRKRLSWNYKYLIGKWDFMGKEAARYNTIVKFINETNVKNAKILDLGCGYGSLYEYLKENEISNYLGVDLSDTAIIKARKHNHKKANYIVADIQKYSTNDYFDIIIFNEVLYYLDNPIETVKKYCNNLDKTGYFIFSFYGERNDLKLELEKEYKLLATKIVEKDSKSTWGINLFEYNKN